MSYAVPSKTDTLVAVCTGMGILVPSPPVPAVNRIHPAPVPEKTWIRFFLSPEKAVTTVTIVAKLVI